LHDLVATETNRVAALLTAQQFPIQGAPASNEEFVARITRYDNAVADLVKLQALLGYWADVANELTLTLAPRRLAEQIRPEGGLVLWNALRWYPVFFLLYATGVAATAAQRYDNLRLVLNAPAPDPDLSQGRMALVRAAVGGLRDAGGHFKVLPGLENHRLPLNDHLFELLRPLFDGLLLLATDFETAFDDFEVLMALQHADVYSAEPSGRAWGPLGRFALRFHSGNMGSPFHRLLAESEREGSSWPPIKGGMFQGSIERFHDTATSFRKTIANLGW
jgi:hypothetical protein